MSDITDNNLTINPGTGGAVVATDYVDDSHFQVMKLAFGNSGDAIRVESGVGLPVDLQDASVNAVVTSINSGVGMDIRNNIGVYGVAGATLVGVTATDFDIRSLTFGSDSVSVLNTVGVTATDLDIRSLTFGSDSVSVLNTVGVTATDLDIRGLTFGTDSVSVLNNVTVVAASNAFASGAQTNLTFGMQNRLLRATTIDTPTTSGAALTAQLATEGGNIEDTVRVVGLSGAYPVDVVPMGLTNISNRTTRVPFNVTDTGALMVELSAGSISVTADVSGLGAISVGDVTVAGLSLAYPTGLTNVMPVCGYTGSDTIPVAITGTNIDIRALDDATDSVSATVSGNVGITGDVRDTINKLAFAKIDGADTLRVSDSALTATNTSLGTIFTETNAIKSNLNNVIDSTANLLKVDVKKISQPSGGTSGNVSNSTNTTTATQMADVTLESGVHLKASPNNTGTIFVGFSGTNPTTGFPLLNGDQIFIETNNLNKIFFASSTASQTLHFCGT